MNLKSLTFFCLLSLFFHFSSISQNVKFNAGLIAGLNFSELEGESITDYFGLNAGIYGSVKFHKNWLIAIELIYSENGEYILPEYYPPTEYGKIRLQHFEFPFHFDLLIDIFKKTPQIDCHLQFGGAYTKILEHKAEDFLNNDITNQIIYNNRDGYLLQLGTVWNFSEHFGLNFRSTLPIRIEGLSWTLAWRLIYTI